MLIPILLVNENCLGAAQTALDKIMAAITSLFYCGI